MTPYPWTTATVYSEPGMFAGWPANHGAWQWGNELLVGFLRGKSGPGTHHNIEEPYEKLLARSLDGGGTWTIEKPNVDFEGKTAEPPPHDLDLSKYIVRVCGRYDTGGEYCRRGGAFYVSADRGKHWLGPYSFVGLEREFSLSGRHCTSRTRQLGNTLFLSTAQADEWGTDWVFTAEFEGGAFHYRDLVCHDRSRAVMPAIAQLGELTLVALRRKGGGQNYIDTFMQYRPGERWKLTSAGTNTGTHNGNPPALCFANGLFVLAYGNRSTRSINMKLSADGWTWSTEKIIRQGQRRDIGYPQLFVMPKGVVCVYYWADTDAEGARIEASFIDPDMALKT